MLTKNKLFKGYAIMLSLLFFISCEKDVSPNNQETVFSNFIIEDEGSIYEEFIFNDDGTFKASIEFTTLYFEEEQFKNNSKINLRYAPSFLEKISAEGEYIETDKNYILVFSELKNEKYYAAPIEDCYMLADSKIENIDEPSSIEKTEINSWNNLPDETDKCFK